MLIGYDTVTPATIPHNPQVVMAYDDGIFTDYALCKRLFPKAHVFSIAVRAQDSADILDVEKFDASPGEAGPWLERMLHEGVWRPCIYASLSAMPAVEANINEHHIPRAEYRLWVADWQNNAHGNHFPHIPHGFDGCQWTDKALGRNLDESLLEPTFVRHVVAPSFPVYRALIEFEPHVWGWDIHPQPLGHRDH